MKQNCEFKSILDIDECSENLNGCQQNCENTPGSFKCKCRPGYMLDYDGKSCIGIAYLLCWIKAKFTLDLKK